LGGHFTHILTFSPFTEHHDDQLHQSHPPCAVYPRRRANNAQHCIHILHTSCLQSNPSAWITSHPTTISSLRSTILLPKSTETIIIGSGISAVFAARQLLHFKAAFKDQPNVLVLEARDLCSGATGWNGGHLQPSSMNKHTNLISWTLSWLIFGIFRI
jgi:hypothetical protein